MRRLLLVLLLSCGLGAAARAQPEAPATAFPPALEANLRGDAGGITAGQRVLLVVGGVGGAAVGLYLLGPAAPLGIAAGTYAAAHAAGLDPTLGSVARAAGLGTLAGVAAGAGTFAYFTLVQGYPDDFSTHIGSLLAGVAVASVATGLLYEARPVLVRTDTGGIVPGAVLRVTF